MDGLADLEYVFCEWCINDEYLPGPRHEYTTEDRGDDVNHTDIEEDQVHRVTLQEARQDLLLKQDKSEAVTTREDLTLQRLDLLVRNRLRSSVISSEYLFKRPVIIHSVLQLGITLELKCVVCVE